MKSKKSSLRAALFLALIGAAFAFNACWQGTPAGGSNMPGGSGNVTSGDNKSGDTNSKNNNPKDSGGKNADGNKSVDTQPNGNNAGGNNSGSTNVNTGGGAGGGTPGGTSGGSGSGGGNTASSIEGITWRAENSSLNTKMTLQLNGGSASATCVIAGQTTLDSGTYTITGNTIEFTGFAGLAAAWGFNDKFKYKVEGDTFTLLKHATNAPIHIFKKS